MADPLVDRGCAALDGVCECRSRADCKHGRDITESLRLQATNVDNDGHLNAARHMRNAAEEIESLREQNRVLRSVNAMYTEENKRMTEKVAARSRLSGARWRR